MSPDRDLFTIDVDALVRKRAAHTFRSPHHGPVELVRQALRRGARAVRVRIDSRSVEVQDDGAAIPTATLDRLARLWTPEEGPEVRVAALEAFEQERGLGLLAALAGSPQEVRIETGSDPGGEWLSLVPPGPPRRGERTGGVGTRVRVSRRGDPDGERRTLRDWCRFAGPGITLDGEPLGGGEVRGAPLLASAPLLDGQDRACGRVWIPSRGSVCRVWLLDQGIQWRLATWPPDQGLLYEATVETPEPPPPALRERVRSTALALCAAALERYGALGPGERDRLDELVFLHHQRTGSRALLGRHAAFLRLGDGARLTVDQVRSMARGGAVAALPGGPPASAYSLDPEVTLAPTPRQWEFLEKDAGIPLSPPPLRPRGWVRTLRRGVVALRDGLLAWGARHLRPDRAVPAHDRTTGEEALVAAVARLLAEGRFRPRGLDRPREASVLLARGGRGGGPAVLIRRVPRTQVVLRRDHPDVRIAAAALERSPDLLSLAIPALFDGETPG